MDREKTERDRLIYNDKFLLFLLLAVSFAGTAAGFIVFYRTFSGSDVLSFAEVHGSTSAPYLTLLLQYLLYDAGIFAAVEFLAASAFGWLLVPPVLFYRCLGAGIGACCYISGFGPVGVVYALVASAIPSVFSVTTHIFACRKAINTSRNIFDFMMGRDAQGKGLLMRFGYIKNAFLYAFALFGTAAVSAALKLWISNIEFEFTDFLIK